MSLSNAQNGDMSEREIPEFSEDEHLSFFFNIEQIYDELPGNKQNYATFSQSLQIGRSLANYIVKQTMKQAEEQFIERNVPLNALSEIIEVATLLIVLPLNDDGTEFTSCQMVEDQEPQINDFDRWRRNRVLMSQVEEDIQDEQEDKVKHLAQSQLTNLSRQRQRLSISTEAKKNTKVFEPKMVPLYQEQEDDEYEDKLRTAKMYELKKKIEIEQKKKEDHIQSQIEKKEGAQQKYTFDYDGKIIIARPIKMEKLQPTNQKVKVELKDLPKTVIDPPLKPVSKGKEVGTKPKVLGNEQEIPNRQVLDRKDVTKDIQGDKGIRPDKSSQFPYETFTMNNGVKLFFESKMKEGQRHQISDSAEQLQYKLSGANFLPGEEIQSHIQQIRLTRTEYKLLTDAGTVMLSQTKQQFAPTETQKIIPVEQNISEIQASTLLKKKPMEKTVQFDQTQSKFEVHPPAPNEKISMKNPRLIETLLITGKPETPISNQLKQDPAPPAEAKNPIDQFNQTLMQSKDQGKQIGNKTAFFPPLKQSKHIKESRVYRGSLEQLYKLPRDRLVAQNLRTSSDFFKQSRSTKNGKTHSDGFQTFYTTHTKFDEKLRQS